MIWAFGTDQLAAYTLVGTFLAVLVLVAVILWFLFRPMLRPV